MLIENTEETPVYFGRPGLQTLSVYDNMNINKVYYQPLLFCFPGIGTKQNLFSLRFTNADALSCHC